MIDTKLDFNDVLMLPKKASAYFKSRKDVNIHISYKSYTGLPLIVSNMPSIGTYNIAKLLTKEKILTFIYKDYPVEYHLSQLKTFETTDYIGLTTGIHEHDLNRILKITKEISVGFINLDTANIYGNFNSVLKTAELIKKQCPDSLLVIGNICTPELISDLVNVGADIIKVGVGSGSACTTRSEVGVGVPQWSAVVDAFSVAQKQGIPIISDGGCVFPGDICKAIGAGAKLVMLGGMLAGAKETENQKIIDGKSYVHFWGLGSREQFDSANISEKDYRSNEGRNLLIPCDVSILEHFKRIKNALRSACTYLGVNKIESLHENAQFIKVTSLINNSLAHYEV